MPKDRRLKLSGNKRFLVYEDGEPFFWLGDTAWELFHRLNREDAELYLENRASKGFTVIQAVLLAELDGLRYPNAFGEVPLTDLDPQRPNEAYFGHVDWIIRTASQKGLFMALLPAWGDKIDKRYNWAEGPEIFTVSNAFAYGRWLGERYKNDKNIIWIMGGDRDPDEKAVEIWRSMANGVIDGVGGKQHTLMSFHPQPFESGSSSRWFHQDDWLDFNMLQTGHDKQKNTFSQVAGDYARIPVKPVIDGEPVYEAHGLGFKPFENGYSSDADVRKYAYWNLFSGAFGHTYGCHSVWQFYTPDRKGINFPIYFWKDALDLAGASQMRHVKNLMTGRPQLCLIPDQSLIADLQEEGEDYLAATRADDGSYAFVYSPTGKRFRLNTGLLAGSALKYSWFNPRDGISTVAQVTAKEQYLAFQPPNWGYGQDWVLVIDSIK
ncbi:glycoside hydrolase family 140 protein [Flavitalea flava]